MIVFLKDNLFIMYCLIFGENTYQFRQLSILFLSALLHVKNPSVRGRGQ